MAARFDCKKLLRFALATLCLLALAMLMPVAARAEGDAQPGQNETAWLTIPENAAKEDASVFFRRKGSAGERETNTGHASLEVYVLQNDSTTKQLEETKLGETKDFEYQYNSNIDSDLYKNYDPDTNSFKPNLTADDPKNKKKGAGVGGYASLDLGVKVSDGYTLYKVEYTVCHSSGGPINTGWKTDDTFGTESKVRPTQYYYLDNITDDTTVKVYIMPTYTIKYEVKYGETVINAADYDTYFTSSGKLNDVTAYPKDAEYSIVGCKKLEGMTPDNYKEEANNNSGSTPKIYPYHRWCTKANETDAVRIAEDAFKYTTTTTVTVPTLTAKGNYTVSGWKVNENKTVGFGDTVNMSDLAQYANENRVIILTAVVTADKPENTDNSGNNNGNGDNGGNNGGDNNNGGNNNNNGGNNGNNGGQESTPTPTPETTPAPTASVTTVTAVAPTATPTATPAPTAEPTATPAPAAVSAHIPQTSDDMPYTLLVVTALASLCAAGALFMKRRSK